MTSAEFANANINASPAPRHVSFKDSTELAWCEDLV